MWGNRMVRKLESNTKLNLIIKIEYEVADKIEYILVIMEQFLEI